MPQPAVPETPPREPLGLTYACDSSLLDASLRSKFMQLDSDEDTQRFIETAQSRPHGSVRRGLQRGLRHWVSDFDANGLLGTYPMHLLSTAQWRVLLGTAAGGRLLDVGAGDGRVTAPLAALFESVSVTETSKPMAWRLKRRGYTFVGGDVSHCPVPAAPYDTISLLNVLDRCAAPLSLLSQAAQALAPQGSLVIALAIPYRPFFYAAGNTPRPLRPLPLTEAMDFETSLSSLLHQVLEPLGLEPTALSRAPYLSWGDTRQSLYTLDDAVVVCRRA